MNANPFLHYGGVPVETWNEFRKVVERRKKLKMLDQVGTGETLTTTEGERFFTLSLQRNGQTEETGIWEYFHINSVNDEFSGLRHINIYGGRTREGGTRDKRQIVTFPVTTDVEVSSLTLKVLMIGFTKCTYHYSLELGFADGPTLLRVKRQLDEWIVPEVGQFNKSTSDKDGDSFGSDMSIDANPEQQAPVTPGQEELASAMAGSGEFTGHDHSSEDGMGGFDVEPLHARVLAFIKAFESDNGVHKEQIVAGMGISYTALANSLESLNENGLIYSTIDDDHFKAAEP